MPKLKALKAQESTASELVFAAELERQGLIAEAERHYRRIVEKQPKEWRALHQLSTIYLSRGDYAQALETMAAAMKANPGAPEAKSNYGFILQKLDRHRDALDYFDRALVLRPDYVSALINRGTSLRRLGRLTEALANFDRALVLDAQNAKAHFNRANVLHELCRFDEALASYAAATAKEPDYADAHWNEGMTRLLLGDFAGGWPKYERRLRSESQKQLRRDFAQPPWTGTEPIAGRTILVHAEQGFGDTLQFVRYVPRLAALGAKVILEVQPALHPLLSGIKGAAQVIARGERLPHFDVYCSVMSLPHAFETSLETIPTEVPYLEAPIDRIQNWRERLPATSGLRVVLAWAGNARHEQDHLRSVPLAKLDRLLDVGASIEWISVQRDLREGDRAFLGQRHIRHVGDELADFVDTAAVLSLADLVITVDTAVAHLAGALRRPVWILLQHCPDFRWLLGRDDTPWYPSARLFRQRQFGEWDAVIAETSEALRREAVSVH